MTRVGLFAVTAAPLAVNAGIVVSSPEITNSGLTPINFEITAPFGGSGLTYTLDYNFSSTNKPTVYGQSGAFVGADGSSAFSNAVNFSGGGLISASATWNTGGDLYKPENGSSPASGNFPPGTRGYVGLQLSNGSGFNYGWADISYNNDTTLTLHRFAVETTLDLPIVAGRCQNLCQPSPPLWLRDPLPLIAPAAVCSAPGIEPPPNHRVRRS